jgi:hypothetical protein
MAGSFAEQNKAATCRAATTAGADGDLDPALVSTICWCFEVLNGLQVRGLIGQGE